MNEEGTVGLGRQAALSGQEEELVLHAFGAANRLKQSFTCAENELERLQQRPPEEAPEESEGAETETKTNGAPPLDLPRVTDIRPANKLLRMLDLT